MSIKGPGEAPKYEKAQTKSLRIGIVHARWNAEIIDSLLTGALATLEEAGVERSNIVVQSVPGAYELPFACARVYQASQHATAVTGTLVSAATDLLGSATDLTKTAKDEPQDKPTASKATGPLDAVIAIGVLIKGATMHFEYIADAVSHGLMKVQLDSGVPVIFGVLTCLTEAQAQSRAGRGEGEGAHNHGEDWASAAVELGLKRRGWGEGKFD